jgi:MFS family permease
MVFRCYQLPLFLTLAAFAISANSVPPLLSTLSHEMALPAWTLGAGITIQYISFFAISWLGGMLGDRHGIPRWVMILSGLFVLAAALALAPFLISSLPAILLWMCILGLAGGLVETFASIGLMENSPSSSSKALCISQAFYALGAFIAPQAASYFLGRSGGWKSAFAIFGALAGGIALVFIVFGRVNARHSDPAEEMARPSEGDSRSTPRGQAVFSFRILIFAYATVEALCGSLKAYAVSTPRRRPPRRVSSGSA